MTSCPTAEPVRTLTLKAIHHGQRRMGINIYERAHDTWRDDSFDLEIIYDVGGGAHAVPVTVQQRQERVRRWLKEDSPTFLDVDPPAAAGVARFSLDFRIDAQKRLTVSGFDIERRIWVLDRQPVVRLA